MVLKMAICVNFVKKFKINLGQKPKFYTSCLFISLSTSIKIVVEVGELV